MLCQVCQNLTADIGCSKHSGVLCQYCLVDYVNYASQMNSMPCCLYPKCYLLLQANQEVAEVYYKLLLGSKWNYSIDLPTFTRHRWNKRIGKLEPAYQETIDFAFSTKYAKLVKMIDQDVARWHSKPSKQLIPPKTKVDETISTLKRCNQIIQGYNDS